MSEKGKENETRKPSPVDVDLPPPYSEVPPPIPSSAAGESSAAGPWSTNHSPIPKIEKPLFPAKPLVESCVVSPHVSLRRTLVGSYGKVSLRACYIGDAATPKLFCAYDYAGLLGHGPGRFSTVLRNGISKDDPVLGAVGDWAKNVEGLEKYSMINMALPEERSEAGSTEETSKVSMEILYAGEAEDGVTDSYRFSTMVKEGKEDGFVPAHFQWTKTRDEDVTDNKRYRQYKIYRLASPTTAPPTASDRLVAELNLKKGLVHTRPWELKFEGDDDLGERVNIMVVLTALRIWALSFVPAR